MSRWQWRLFRWKHKRPKEKLEEILKIITITALIVAVILIGVKGV